MISDAYESFYEFIDSKVNFLNDYLDPNSEEE